MQTITVPFYGNELYVVDHNGEVYTPMKPIVEGMGMDWMGQYTKLKQRFAKGIEEITIPTGGGPQRMLCLQLRKLAGWLQTVNPKVKPEIRERIIQYQEECDDVLYDYWTKGHAINPRHMSPMDRLNEACADYKFEEQKASGHGKGLSDWKKIKPQCLNRIHRLVSEIDGIIDMVLAETGKGKLTRT